MKFIGGIEPLSGELDSGANYQVVEGLYRRTISIIMPTIQNREFLWKMESAF